MNDDFRGQSMTTTETRIMPLITSVSPSQYADARGIAVDKVLCWIHSGELRAVNVARSRIGRPRYQFPLDAIEAFEEARQVQPPAPSTPHRNRTQIVKEYV